MKRFAYVLLIGISAIISCTDSPGTYYPRYSTFPNEKAISARVIELDTALFRYPFRVVVKDSIAIVMDLHNADNYFHAFTYPNWKHIVSFGNGVKDRKKCFRPKHSSSTPSIPYMHSMQTRCRSHAGRFQQKTIQLQDRK